MAYKKWKQLDPLAKLFIVVMTPFAFFWIAIQTAAALTAETANWWTE